MANNSNNFGPLDPLTPERKAELKKKINPTLTYSHLLPEEQKMVKEFVGLQIWKGVFGGFVGYLIGKLYGKRSWKCPSIGH